MPDVVISANHTLHDITEGNPNFVGIVHLQSQDGKEFMFGYPSQKDLDEGNIRFAQSRGGYASVNITKPEVGMVALRSLTPAPVSLRIWSDAIARPVAAPVASATPAMPLRSSQGESKTDKNLSILLWVAVIAALLYVLSKRKK